jgi:hypothetical protein
MVSIIEYLFIVSPPHTDEIKKPPPFKAVAYVSLVEIYIADQMTLLLLLATCSWAL